MADYLFTYGTLRLDQSHPMAGYLAGNSELLGLGVLSGAQLFRIDWYPALIESGDATDQVVGDVFELHSPDALKKIDEYEGIGVGEEPYEYRRARVRVKTERGEIDSWVYFYNVPLPESAERIESGDFLNP